MFQPAKGALLPSLVEDPSSSTAANTAMSTFESPACSLAPRSAASSSALGSIQLAFALIGVLLLLSAAQVVRIRHPEGAAAG